MNAETKDYSIHTLKNKHSLAAVIRQKHWEKIHQENKVYNRNFTFRPCYKD